MNINPKVRKCMNVNISVHHEINILENDPHCLRLNVLTQTMNLTCLICNAVENTLRLTLECRVHIFVQRNFYVSTDILL